MNYNIIQTGSKGNATVIEDVILVDCGVSFKKLKPYYEDIKLVLLTHSHSDHLNRTAIRKLSVERPTLRFGCGRWLVNDLIKFGVDKKNIDVYEMDKRYNYGKIKIQPFELFHDVCNCGYKIHVNDLKYLYATDTSRIETTAPGYDLYMLEANYDDDELDKRIEEKIISGEYVYEYNLPSRHLSKKQADDFIYANIKSNGKYIYMHQHKE